MTRARNKIVAALAHELRQEFRDKAKIRVRGNEIKIRLERC